MSNIVAVDSKLSDINIPSKTEVMQMVFDDLRNNRPKPLPENWDLKTFRIHTRFVSIPNMALMGTNSSTKAPEKGWRSTPNLKFLQFTCNVQRSEPSELYDSKSLVEGKLSGSTSNISVRPNSAGDAPDLPVSDTMQDTDDGPVTAVENRRPRRSFWCRTKKFVRRLFCCCCCSVEMIDQ